MIRFWLLTALRAPNRSLGMMSVDLSSLLLHSSPPSLLLSYFTTPPSFTIHLCCLSESSREHCSASLQKLENLEQTEGSASLTGCTLSLAEAPDPTCCLRPPTPSFQTSHSHFPGATSSRPPRELSGKKMNSNPLKSDSCQLCHN